MQTARPTGPRRAFSLGEVAATLAVTGLSRIEVAGNIDHGPVPYEVVREVTARLNSSFGSWPLLRADGDIRLPTLAIVLDPGFIPVPGDEWTIAEAGGQLELGPILLQQLPAPLAWSLAVDDQRLVLGVTVTSSPGPDVDGDGNGRVDIVDLVSVLAAWS